VGGGEVKVSAVFEFDWKVLIFVFFVDRRLLRANFFSFRFQCVNDWERIVSNVIHHVAGTSDIGSIW
jgi:hypothetical protein